MPDCMARAAMSISGTKNSLRSKRSPTSLMAGIKASNSNVEGVTPSANAALTPLDTTSLFPLITPS